MVFLPCTGNPLKPMSQRMKQISPIRLRKQSYSKYSDTRRSGFATTRASKLQYWPTA
jgi:hypothetical protein